MQAEPLRSSSTPDAPEFTPPGDIPGRVREFCRRTGQPVPETVGQVARCLYESLALKYRFALEQLGRATGQNFSCLHIIGGGTQAKLLCRMTADSIGLPVVAGPIEATVLGNIAMQLIANGQIRDVDEARQIIARSEKVLNYQPTEAGAYRTAYEIYFKSVKAS